MNANDIERIRQTWALAAADPDRTTLAFYANLFRMDPSTQPLFQGDMQLQARKLAQTLGFIVDHLDDLETLVPIAQDLAVRHVDYAVRREHYASVGAALIATFQQLLGGRFAAEDAQAWGDAYHILSEVMCDKAYPEPA